MDHMPTTAIPDEATRKALAGEGAELIGEIVKRMDMPHVAAQMRDPVSYTHLDVYKRQPPPSTTSITFPAATSLQTSAAL